VEIGACLSSQFECVGLIIVSQSLQRVKIKTTRIHRCVHVQPGLSSTRSSCAKGSHFPNALQFWPWPRMDTVVNQRHPDTFSFSVDPHREKRSSPLALHLPLCHFGAAQCHALCPTLGRCIDVASMPCRGYRVVREDLRLRCFFLRLDEVHSQSSRYTAPLESEKRSQCKVWRGSSYAFHLCSKSPSRHILGRNNHS